MAQTAVQDRGDALVRVRDRTRVSDAQRRWLKRGLESAGGKLPLFDEHGQRYDMRMIRSAIDHGLAEPWFSNPIKPDWLVCRLTDKGRRALIDG